MPEERDAARAALLALLDHLSTPATIIVITKAGPLGTFQIVPTDGTTADVRADILRFLEDAAPAPLTLNKLLDSFEAEGTEVSDRTVKRYLRELTTEKKIENPKHARPAGYRIKG